MKKELQTFGAVLAVGTASLMAGSASAVTLPTASVTVNASTYDVTYFTGTQQSNSARFTTAEMPWWGDSSLAQTFAAAVGTKLGTPLLGSIGPQFAYANTTSTVFGYSYDTAYSDTANPRANSFGSNFSAPFAIATLQSTAPASVPAPLPIFGAAAAFGATKRLRGLSRRLHRSTTELT